jgi:hypothetical protein
MKKILSVSTIFLAAFLLFAQDEEVNQPVPNAEVSGQVLQNVFFVGLQIGNLPELRDRFEDMIRSRWGMESNIRFVPRDQTLRIIRRAFQDRAVEVDPTLFNELRKHNLQNSIALLVSVEEYSIQPVRRRLIGGNAEGRLDARFLFYDVAQERAILVTQTSSVSRIKKGLIWWRSPSDRVHITAADRMKINTELLEDAVAKGFDMMKIAVSLKNNTN